MKSTCFFNLEQIANWQLDNSLSEVELPELQRGFVWKNHQIETLWDSLLRGFPIGSFLLSKTESEGYFLLDGQQRATTIALGFYSPWLEDQEKIGFWSIRNIPTVWVDVYPKEITENQKFVIRVITQSHPWGYQCINNSNVLGITDRKIALEIFKKNPVNKNIGYTKLSLTNVFPYDVNLPVPLSFLVKSLESEDWKNNLIKMCNTSLPIQFIKTKRNKDKYIDKLIDIIENDKIQESLVDSIKNLKNFEIPCCIVPKRVLEAEDEQTGEDPTLFVRFNSAGTRIEGEELIYSIYKASFPNAKKLVENVGLGFLSPSKVINLVSRLAWSEMKKDVYPNTINVNEFRKLINNKTFVKHLNALIGNEHDQPAVKLFNKAIDILLSENDISLPPVLVKYLITNSTEIFLMLLHWLKTHSKYQQSKELNRRILASFTALSWFSIDKTNYVSEIWDNIKLEDFWSKNVMQKPYYKKEHFIMYPLIQPSILKDFLIEEVVNRGTTWENLYTRKGDKISTIYRKVLSTKIFDEDAVTKINDIWSYFINRLVVNRALVLFAQRKYINDNFDDFNQIETLEDTNTPWDWDHIYPTSWVYGKRYVHENVRSWTYKIGNLRALSLEDNRSENNSLSPCERLKEETSRNDGFVNDDWSYWEKISERIYDDKKAIKSHLKAIIIRTCNIYEDWYNTLNVEKIFGA